MAGYERLRLFCALRLPPETLERLALWQAAALRGGRAVTRQNLHLTLAFLGFRAVSEVPAIAGALRDAAAGSGALRLRVCGYRETRNVGMLTFEDEGGRATALAGRLHESLELLGVYEREARPWLPHVTVLRFGERPHLRPELPGLADLAPSDAAVFISRLRPGGAVYEALEAVPLGG
ncbi:MAG TPA: 2'-5' RNA ligase family protein [Gaiellaceae bacterium]|nr:2'-5' RNA ligase family protein [Gaiellaceae bacterium]